MTNVVLVGFMGSGKTVVGKALAERLRRPFVDVDQLIEAEAGRSIEAIFDDETEAGFRARESARLRQVLSRDGQVIAVGGGAPLDSGNWQAIRNGNWVVALTAKPEELAARLNGATDRPLLRHGVRPAIESLLPARLSRYLEADLVVPTDRRTPEAVSATIVDALPRGAAERIEVNVHGSPHEVVVGSSLRHLVPSVLTRRNVHGAVAIVTDKVVGPAHARPLEEVLGSGGWQVCRYEVPAGERAKTLETMAALYEFLGKANVDRTGAMIALGGGVVGDLTGFAAASWMRGIPYVQVPTTLLAMVDSSIGGKTGINLPSGKNLVGAVYQPAAIVCDLDYLSTLPDADYRAAFAEIIKCAVAGDRALFEDLRSAHDEALAREPAVLMRIVARTATFKARIVSEDPYEREQRAVLNYGHTVAHALEAVLGYGVIRHGEAVAWGMRVAARLSQESGVCSAAVVRAQDRLLAEYGLLESAPRVDVSAIMAAVQHDKKTRGGEPRWVLLRDIGRVEYGHQVGRERVEAVLEEVLRS